MKTLVFAATVAQAQERIAREGIRTAVCRIVLQKEQVLGLDPARFVDVVCEGAEASDRCREALEYWRERRALHSVAAVARTATSDRT
jgi:hypothetical protein